MAMEALLTLSNARNRSRVSQREASQLSATMEAYGGRVLKRNNNNRRKNTQVN